MVFILKNRLKIRRQTIEYPCSQFRYVIPSGFPLLELAWIRVNSRIDIEHSPHRGFSLWCCAFSHQHEPCLDVLNYAVKQSGSESVHLLLLCASWARRWASSASQEMHIANSPQQPEHNRLSNDKTILHGLNLSALNLTTSSWWRCWVR